MPKGRRRSFEAIEALRIRFIGYWMLPFGRMILGFVRGMPLKIWH